MSIHTRGLVSAVVLAYLFSPSPGPSSAGELIVDLGKSQDITLVGAIRRWDEDGASRFPVDPSAKIENPRVDGRAQPGPEGRWVFSDLADGPYDLVICTKSRIRVEGFRYPPLREFDPFLSSDARSPDDETRDEIGREIATARHYENKVAPLYWASNGEKQVRILVQLVRDRPTSFDAEFGAPVATVRHEIWQYTRSYGSWTKDRRTEVLDRILLTREEFRRWTWVWDPRLGGIKVGRKPVTIAYRLPTKFDPQTVRGWFPDR